MLKAVIFDLDGTLIDSESVAVEAFQLAHAQVAGAGEPPVAEFLARAGRPFESICADLGLPDGMVTVFRSASIRLRGRVRVFDGVLPVLVALRGTPMSVLTGKDRFRTEQLLDELDLAGFFTGVCTPDDPPAAKPSPDGVRWLCGLMDVMTAECVVVGDAVNDMRAGRSAGAQTVGCAWGVDSPEDLRAAGADTVIATPYDLLPLLQEAGLPAGPTPTTTPVEGKLP